MISVILLFLLFCLVLILSGSFLVKSLVKITSFLRLGEFVVGFIIMAFATTIPEFFIGITSALSKTNDIALGTVIGSNIADLSLIMGIVILLSKKGIKFEHKSLKRDTTYMFLIALLPLALMYFGNVISQNDGIILILVLSLYIFRMLKRRTQFTKTIKDDIKRYEILLYTFVFIISLIVLYLSADYVVKYATLLSIELSLPTILIGLLLVALGTSLPELIFGTRAILSGHPDMILGDILGAVVVNSTLVIGVSAMIFPITANWLLFWISAAFMMLIAFIFMTFVHTGRKLYWQQGIVLIWLYMFFVMIELYVKTL